MIDFFIVGTPLSLLPAINFLFWNIILARVITTSPLFDDWYLGTLSLFSKLPVIRYEYILLWIFSTFCLIKFNGQTPGKHLLNIRVTNVNSTVLTFGKAFLREFLKILPFFLFFYPLPQLHLSPFVQWVFTFFWIVLFSIWYLFMLIDKRKQNIYDKLAGTMVVTSQ